MPASHQPLQTRQGPGPRSLGNPQGRCPCRWRCASRELGERGNLLPGRALLYRLKRATPTKYEGLHCRLKFPGKNQSAAFLRTCILQGLMDIYAEEQPVG